MKTITPTISQLRMLASISGKQWLILESSISEFALSALDVPEKANAMDIDLEDFFQLRPPASIDGDGIASVHVHGALMDSCPPVYEKLGLVTCYSTISAEINQSIEAGAKGILLVFNSPGGTVSGNVECANHIAGLTIPTVAYCDSKSCSAAYKLTAGTRGVVARETAIVGNIGTIQSWMDCTEFWRSNGIEFKALTSEGADLKSTFHLEPNATQLQFLQESVDQAGKQFREHVAKGREAAGAELDPEVWRAGWYSGERAGQLGLIDAIGGIEDAKAVLRGLIDTAQGAGI